MENRVTLMSSSCGLLCVATEQQQLELVSRRGACEGLCGSLMNVRVDVEHLAALKPASFDPTHHQHHQHHQHHL